MKPHRAMTVAAACLLTAAAAQAYDGTNCKAPGDCWEPKPGYPEKVAGSKYDPKHDPVELRKNEDAVKAMEARNAKRLEAAQKTGVFKFKPD
ncbi:methanol dehydrogenase [Rubrivivax gelatinosus]|uniref:Methanol dehydrogenase [cytochrome c] subunit 2 n=1 Tax=Rubrivivax gelatinosus TaxID=28068 RepID=A0A4R2M6H5_RUBGE|nr:methanol dehydrogenase [Rubrivivax gelatinosus]MBK1687844.1 methanol dehydrogenase [Rubrivivax gelatinosus]TCP01691.1 methanol dehydrogenase (cytochrome) small subunit [Rubrivivax gelatinosus]